MIADGFLRWPEGAPAVVAVLAACVALGAVDRRRARRVRDLVGPRVALLSSLGARRRLVRRWLGAAGVTLAAAALMQPTFGVERRTAGARGVDLLVALDVSRSMLAGDVAPTRLEAARQAIRDLARRLRGDRLGLLVFAGEARLLVPLTRDMDSLAGLVELADPFLIERGGTDLGAALDASLRAVERGGDGAGVVVLITDGEDLEGRGLTAASACADRGVVVHCVGMGSAAGAKIVVDDGDGAGFLVDRAGAEVVTAMDAASLERIAAATGGRFVAAGDSPGAALGALFERHVRPAAAAEEGGGSERANRYQWPLLLGFLLLLAELATTDRRAS